MPLKNILILDNSTAPTGAFNSILAVTEKLKEQYRIFYALPSKDLINKIGNEKAYYLPFLEIQKSWNLILYFPVLFLNALRVLNIVKTRKIDILHVNDIYNMLGIIVKILFPKIKLVYHVRLLPNSYVQKLYSLWVKLVFSNSDSILCVSRAVASKLPDSEKKNIIYDAAPVPENAGKDKYPDFTFLYVGNFIKGKGQDLAIEAYSLVKERLQRCKLLFIGGDMSKSKNKLFKNNLQQKVKDYGLEGRMEFLDYKEDLSEYYQSANVVVNFSESESFSMVCLESLLNGTPVIATRCGGPEEIIQDGLNGILVDNKNIKEMAEAMVTIYENKELRIKMNLASKNIVHRFNVEASAAKLSEIYRSL